MESTHNSPTATLCLIGSFPPAPSGQALVNESFRQLAQAAGANVITIDLAPPPGPATVRRRLSRLPKVLAGIRRLFSLLARRRADAIYIGVAGGYGQLYDLTFVSLTRLSSVRLFIHHDSYAYLAKRRRLTATLLRISGPSATHIVLCEDMKQRLTDLYGRALRIVVIANATNTEPPTDPPRVRTKLRTIGFVSHISRSKGVLEFLDVVERICVSQPGVRALLAGPIEEPSLKQVIQGRLARAPQIKYVGPVYGEAKSRFYAEIDAFVFPTRHANEADPRVINEALSHGVAVVALGRGCIRSVVAGGGGAVLAEGTDFVADATRLLLEWYENPTLFSSISSAALANSARLKADQGARLDALIGELTSIAPATCDS